MAESGLTTGIPELDHLIGGVLPGDNIVLEADSVVPVNNFSAGFISARAAEKCPLVYVSFNRSPQTIHGNFASLMPEGGFQIVDCFSHGKGSGDSVFLDFYDSPAASLGSAILIKDPASPASLEETILSISPGGRPGPRYLFDSLTGMLDLWGDEDRVLRFFGYMCPRLFILNTVAFWLLEREAYSQRSLAKVQHVTQVVLDVRSDQGIHTVTVNKAANRACPEIGIPKHIVFEDGRLLIEAVSREDRELALLTALGESLGSALDPSAFFERTIGILANELGMIRCTIVLLDSATDRLRIAAAQGLTDAERALGQYEIGEGVTGNVVLTGRPEVVPDLREDARFLDRTTARRTETDRPIAFICVPLKVDEQVVGAISVDRPFGVKATLDKDLRLLTIVASTVSQVLKINRMIQVEKEKILARDVKLLSELQGRYRLDRVAGQSKAMQKALADAAAAAKSSAEILITGDTGTGKELIANVVHYNSDRASGPFVKINCGALPETLLESELFGHVRGSFTGATRDRKGRFELADKGTLFLDEVAEMSPWLQVKLLRVLQHMEFEPVGGTETVRVDVRIVAATNKDLRKAMRDGSFREDLYYRLNVIPIHMPPLRDRKEDIPLLIDHFLELYNRKNNKNVTKLSQEVLDALLRHSWPGNIRELENAVERAVVLSPGETITPDILPEEVTARKRRPAGSALPGVEALRAQMTEYCGNVPDIGQALQDLSRLVEETILKSALALGLGQRNLAARLGISRMTLRKKLRALKLTQGK